MRVESVVAALQTDLSKDSISLAKHSENGFIIQRRPETIALLLHKTMVPNGAQLYLSTPNAEMLDFMKKYVHCTFNLF